MTTGTKTPSEVVQELLEGIATGPGPHLADLYAEDAEVELPFARPGGLHLRGRGALRAHFTQAGRAPLRLVPERIRLHRTEDPELVIAEYDYRGEATALRRSFVVANLQVVRVRDGRIVQSRDFHDHAAIAAALRP